MQKKGQGIQDSFCEKCGIIPHKGEVTDMAISYKEEPSGYTCFCGGSILTRSQIPYRPRCGIEGIIGPGSENIATEQNRVVTGYHCEKCGIEYHKLPEDQS